MQKETINKLLIFIVIYTIKIKKDYRIKITNLV